jgi:MAX-like protein X
MDELCRTTMLWIDNSCSLMEVRPGEISPEAQVAQQFLTLFSSPAVSNKLREISTTTDILSDNPTSLQDEVLKAVKKIKSRAHESPR